MRKDRHFRLYDTEQNQVVLQVYVPHGQSLRQTVANAATEFQVDLRGDYRIDRMVRIESRLTWQAEGVVTIG